MSLACATGCTQRDRHLSDCPCADPQHEHGTRIIPAERIPGYSPDWPTDVEGLEVTCGCTGCLPRPPADHLAVCPHCEYTARDGLAELPDLWVDLAERPRLAGVSKAPDSEGDTPDPMSDARRDARSAIKAALVFWCVILDEDHDITVPDEARIAATTRSIAAWHSDSARRCRENGQAEEAHRHATAAAAARDDRETGRDILRAICEHITRHIDTLLAGDDAALFVRQVSDARHEARRRAYPTRPGSVRIGCACGSSINVTIAGATCTDCGTVIAPPVDTEGDGLPSTAVDLAGWLLVAHGIDLGSGSHARIRQWAVRYPEEVVRAGRNDRGHVVYERPGVLAVAKRLAARKGAAA